MKISPKVLKLTKYAGPAFAAIMTFAGEVENIKLKRTVANLVKEVAELKKK